MADELVNIFEEIQDGDTRISIRSRIEELESAMFECEQLPIKTTHHFAQGLYAREIFIPKGTLLTGKIHMEEHLNIISKGAILVVTEFGVKRVEAPCTLVSQPGTKRVGYALEDTVWTTIHANELNEKDLEQLELKLIAPDYSTVPTLDETKKLKEA